MSKVMGWLRPEVGEKRAKVIEESAKKAFKAGGWFTSGSDLLPYDYYAERAQEELGEFNETEMKFCKAVVIHLMDNHRLGIED